MTVASRILLVLAGLVGAAGVAVAAAAAHGDSRNLSGMATILLAHAPAILALALLGKGRVLMAGAFILSGGTLLFGADLAVRELAGNAMLTGAAPLAGGLMILGWIALAAAGLTARANP